MYPKLKWRILQVAKNQYRFAHRIGRSESWVSELIHGRRTPTQEERGLLKRHLDVEDLDELFSEEW